MPDGDEPDRSAAFRILNRYTPLSWGSICQMLDRDDYLEALAAADDRYEITDKLRRDDETRLLEVMP